MKFTIFGIVATCMIIATARADKECVDDAGNECYHTFIALKGDPEQECSRFIDMADCMRDTAHKCDVRDEDDLEAINFSVSILEALGETCEDEKNDKRDMKRAYKRAMKRMLQRSV